MPFLEMPKAKKSCRSETYDRSTTAVADNECLANLAHRVSNLTEQLMTELLEISSYPNFWVFPSLEERAQSCSFRFLNQLQRGATSEAMV